jgi:hypothetical protein
VEAQTLRRQCSRRGPGDCVQFIAIANASNSVKSSFGDVEAWNPDSMMAARNGGETVEFRRVMASETEKDPADWSCQYKSQLGVDARIS